MTHIEKRANELIAEHGLADAIRIADYNARYSQYEQVAGFYRGVVGYLKDSQARAALPAAA